MFKEKQSKWNKIKIRMACMITRINLTYSYVTYFDDVLNYGLDSERCRPNLILTHIGTDHPPHPHFTWNWK